MIVAMTRTRAAEQLFACIKVAGTARWKSGLCFSRVESVVRQDPSPAKAGKQRLASLGSRDWLC